VASCHVSAASSSSKKTPSPSSRWQWCDKVYCVSVCERATHHTSQCSPECRAVEARRVSYVPLPLPLLPCGRLESRLPFSHKRTDEASMVRGKRHGSMVLHLGAGLIGNSCILLAFIVGVPTRKRRCTSLTHLRSLSIQRRLHTPVLGPAIDGDYYNHGSLPQCWWRDMQIASSHASAFTQKGDRNRTKCFVPLNCPGVRQPMQDDKQQILGARMPCFAPACSPCPHSGSPLEATSSQIVFPPTCSTWGPSISLNRPVEHPSRPNRTTADRFLA
jgi:hypothetical protein